MIRQEYKRYLKSYKTVIIIITMLIFTIVSYYFTNLEKLDFIQQLSSGAVDLDMARLKQAIAGYNGFRFFFSFYNLSDEFNIAILILYAWIGIFISSAFQQQKENGFGNFIIARCGYAKYKKAVITAQSLYIMTVLLIIFVLQIILAYFVGGADTMYYKTGGFELNAAQCVVVIVLQFLVLSFYCICINVIASACNLFIRNQYAIQAVPVVLFALVPMLIGSTVANVFHWSELVFDVVIPFEYLTGIFKMINTFYLSDGIVMIISMAVFVILSKILSTLNIRQMEKNYI